MNPMEMIKLKGLYEQFVKRHPRLPQFAQKAASSIQEGTVDDMKITLPDGETFMTNVKVLPEDMEMISALKKMHG